MITLTVIGLLIYLYCGWIFFRYARDSEWTIMSMHNQSFKEFLLCGIWFFVTVISIMCIAVWLIKTVIHLIITYLP